MCGIAGAINRELNIPLLTECLYHRGPDAQHTMHFEKGVLHHHRLAILDLEGGQQPMSHHHLSIIFNGEIYNHLDVRKDMGLRCQTNSDTETILHAYEQAGNACFEKFDGMFALAILDRRSNELILVRDRAGKKPLYYFADGKSLFFASELNAIRKQMDLSINTNAIQQYTRMGYFYRAATPYNNVYELPAGSYAVVDLHNPVPKVNSWWNIHAYYQQNSGDSFETALAKTDGILHTAVRRRVESSDLEVGSFLSGGIDSGIVTAIASQYNRSLKTFTVSFDGEYDEAPLARLVADRYRTNHHEIRISFGNLINDVETILSNYGEPFFDSSAIPSFYVSKEAKKYLTVILNGDGGDELFGGYRRYVPFAKMDFFKPGFALQAAAKLMHTLMPVPHEKKSRYNYIYRLADLARKQGFETYLSATIDIFEGFEESLVYDKTAFDTVKQDFAKINDSGMTGLKKMMNLDFDFILAGDLLVKMDIATMAHSLEGRSPLLCKEFLEYIPTISDQYKLQGGRTKVILRKLSEKYLPGELINQPKRGFEIPLKKWIDGQLSELIKDYILNPQSFCAGFTKPGFIVKLWDRKLNCGDEKRAKMIWTLFAMEVWYRKCFLKSN